jgi:hypothetical protein
MSVPLDRLYHYLGDCVNHDLIIYRWTPHGSRKLEELTQLTNYPQHQLEKNPLVVFHDQEPLDFLFYTKEQLYNNAKSFFSKMSDSFFMLEHPVLNYVAGMHLRPPQVCSNQFDLTVLVHSELNSRQLKYFVKANFVPVYIWSHAMIALDWFRYAKHDPALVYVPTQIQKTFLVYNRAWSGTREYRLYFAQQLATHDLTSHTQTAFASVDNDTHYVDHVFANKKFQIHLHNLEQLYPANTAHSGSSADYCGADYADCGIEIVLETLFDDSRWHLTEKTLRPIACGKPFLLAATPGSLQYLRNYGFETFADVIDETYDTIADGAARLDAIIQEMKRIADLDTAAKQVLYTKLHEIAQRNKQRFFNGLFDQVMEEYRTNLDQAMVIMQQHCTGQHRVVIGQLLQQN